MMLRAAQPKEQVLFFRQPALYQMALLWLALAKHRVSKLNSQTRS